MRTDRATHRSRPAAVGMRQATSPTCRAVCARSQVRQTLVVRVPAHPRMGGRAAGPGAAAAARRRGACRSAAGTRVGGDHAGPGASPRMFVGLARAELAAASGCQHVVDPGRAAAQLGLRELERAPARGSCAAPRAAGRARPGRARGGRRRGRRPAARTGCRGARRLAASASTSCTSRTCALNAAARSAHSGSSASRWPYSFIDEPQPATLVDDRVDVQRARTRRSSRRARPSAASSRPACSSSAPQHCCSRGDEDVAALGGEHAGGGRVDPVEEHVLDAAGEQRDRGRAGARRPGVRRAARRTRRAADTGGSSDSSAASRPGSRSASARIAGDRPQRW